MSEEGFISNELLNCPFCGGKTYIVQVGNSFTKRRGFDVGCSKCGIKHSARVAKMDIEKAKEYCIKYWNTRAISTQEAIDVIENLEYALKSFTPKAKEYECFQQAETLLTKLKGTKITDLEQHLKQAIDKTVAECAGELGRVFNNSQIRLEISHKLTLQEYSDNIDKITGIFR